MSLEVKKNFFASGAIAYAFNHEHDEESMRRLTSIPKSAAKEITFL